MKKWTLLDQAVTPDGKTMALYERDGEYTIRVDGLDLMSTRRHYSEERLAELACAPLKQKSNARVLIGGLGLGFTLRAALEHVACDSSIVVCEIMDSVIAWNRNPAFKLGLEAMNDPRVEVLATDVAKVIRQRPAYFDTIILDVDNGPDAFSTESNLGLYSASGLSLTLRALRPGGGVAYWSATADPAFARRLSQAGFDVKTEKCRAHITSGAWHTLFLGRVTQKSGAK